MTTDKDSRRCRVLIADDDDDIRLIVSTAVASLGHDTVTAADGAEALAALESGLPDLAILDVGMPHHMGTEVCRKIKQSSNGQLVPVIMLTARDGVRDKVEAFEGGADDYLTKPFHLHELQARVKALLRVRELNLRLQEKNRELQEMQERLVRQERQEVVGQMAGTAAHALGQPLSAMMLNCHLLEKLPPTDHRYQKALQAIKSDVRRMSDMIEKLRHVDADKKCEYHGKTNILDMPESAPKK